MEGPFSIILNLTLGMASVRGLPHIIHPRRHTPVIGWFLTGRTAARRIYGTLLEPLAAGPSGRRLRHPDRGGGRFADRARTAALLPLRHPHCRGHVPLRGLRERRLGYRQL